MPTGYNPNRRSRGRFAAALVTTGLLAGVPAASASSAPFLPANDSFVVDGRP
jgi:hypothetical protein